MKCAEVREMLPAYAREAEPTLSVRRHLSRCDDCSAELGRYRALLVSLGSLEQAPVEVPPGLLARLVAVPDRATRLDHVRVHVSRNRLAYAGGAAAAVAVAGAAGAAVWRLRRQGRLAAA